MWNRGFVLSAGIGVNPDVTVELSGMHRVRDNDTGRGGGTATPEGLWGHLLGLGPPRRGAHAGEDACHSERRPPGGHRGVRPEPWFLSARDGEVRPCTPLPVPTPRPSEGPRVPAVGKRGLGGVAAELLGGDTDPRSPLGSDSAAPSRAGRTAAWNTGCPGSPQNQQLTFPCGSPAILPHRPGTLPMATPSPGAPTAEAGQGRARGRGSEPPAGRPRPPLWGPPEASTGGPRRAGPSGEGGGGGRALTQL